MPETGGPGNRDLGRSGPPSAPPFRSPAFRWFFAGWTVTMAGSAMSPVALAFGVLDLTGSAAWLSAVLAAAMVPLVVTMILGGGIADRYRRDRVLAWASGSAGVSQTGVAMVLLTHQQPAYLLPLAAGNGIFQALTTPTLRGIVPQLAGGRGIQQANSLLASARNITRLTGPAIAGLLTVAVGGGWAIAADALSFLLAAGCFARMSLPDIPDRESATSMLRELRQGWDYFSARSWMWSVTLAFAAFNAVFAGVWQILGPVIAADTIGARGWGLVLSARGAGALLSTVAMVGLTVRQPMVWALSLMTSAAGPLILLGVGANTLWLAAAAFVAGVAAEFFTVVWSTVWHIHVPERLSSRVGAFDEFGSFASIPVGQLSVPPLAAAFGAASVAIAGGAVTVAAMLLPLCVPALRRIEMSPPVRESVDGRGRGERH
ncbi:MAG TPA: MFS transporter [Mycobacteriales bacterium]|nr:MFS transporter [Mycobacteriales bacterium]